MALEFDHCFVLTPPGAALAERIADCGLREGPANSHPGQGTANRRFFCPGFTLELLYLRDQAEALNGPGAGLRLAERARASSASPFGMVLRDDASGNAFPGWRYRAEYFPDGPGFLVGDNSDLLAEPLCVCLPPGLPRADPALAEANPDWRLTGLRLAVPVAQASIPLQAVAGCAPVSLELDAPHRLELIFNDGRAGRELDLVAELALRIRW